MNIIDKIALLLFSTLLPYMVAVQLTIEDFSPIMMSGEYRFWFVFKEVFVILFGG